MKHSRHSSAGIQWTRAEPNDNAPSECLFHEAVEYIERGLLVFYLNFTGRPNKKGNKTTNKLARTPDSRDRLPFIQILQSQWGHY